MNDLLGVPKVDERPLTKIDFNEPGMKAVLDENRDVLGFKIEGGFVFIFRSHGIDTRIALSVEALCAAVDIAAALVKNTENDSAPNTDIGTTKP